ncbi:MAG: aldo/keto reductase [Gammaproteobacteria bacterium]|nr:aldo/keto reductase [Gammaproteobacteria bacterium]
MKYITYNTEKISKLSLGTVQFGIDYGIANNNGQPRQNDVDEILNYVCSKGINCLDTAQGYGNSEEVIGKYLKTIEYNDISVVSKVDSKELILKEINFIDSIKNSISKLEVDSLFGLLMHNSNLMNQWNDEFSNKVSLLKEKKMIKYFGVSIYTNDEFDMALNNEDIDIIQVPFNIFDQRALHNKWFEKAKNKNKLIFIRSIYLQGLLLMDINKIPDKLGKAKQHLEALEEYSQNLRITRNELCLSYVNTIAKDSSLLFGCETLYQAKQNLDTFENIKDLDENNLKKIDDTFGNVSESIYNPTKW